MFSKKIVAAAALLALAAGAQADVKLYGQVDMSVGKFESFDNIGNNGSIKSTNKVESGVMSTGSYIGFSGSEDLGGGVKALFVLESHIGADVGSAGATLQSNFKESTATQFWSRSSHVALAGNFGKVALGQYDSPLYTMLTSYSPFGDSQVFAPNQVLHYGSTLLGTGNYADGIAQGTSWVNSITYETPTMSGFNAILQFAPKENTSTATTNKNNVAFGASYNAGPLAVSAVYSLTGNNQNEFYTDNLKTTGLAASYNFGVVSVSGIYTKTKEDYGTNPFNTKFYQLGATYPVSAAGKVMAAYGERKFGKTGNEKAKQFSLGYEHTISKRTSVYAAFTELKLNRELASDVFEINKGISSQNLAFGIKHNF